MGLSVVEQNLASVYDFRYSLFSACRSFLHVHFSGTALTSQAAEQVFSGFLWFDYCQVPAGPPLLKHSLPLPFKLFA